MATSQTPAYKGSTRRVVIAFDIGTTFSGVSYCILDPGVVPKICSLTRCVASLFFDLVAVLMLAFFFFHQRTLIPRITSCKSQISRTGACRWVAEDTHRDVLRSFWEDAECWR